MELVRFVGDQLHDLLGISDKYVAEYFIGLAGQSASAASFIQKLRDTDAVTVDNRVIVFAEELWNKVSQRLSSLTYDTWLPECRATD